MMLFIANSSSYEVSRKVEKKCLLGFESQSFRNSDICWSMGLLSK